MSVVIKFALSIAVLVAVAVVGLRIRKLRRDEARHRFQRVDRRLLTPPPSPYTPSKGFRLLDGELPVPARPEPMRPRLEPSHDYVFSDAQLPSLDEGPIAASRHDTQWALSRSGHRPLVSGSGARVGVISLVVLVLIGVIGFYAQLRSAKDRPSTVSTTRAPNPSTTTTTAFPASFAPAAVSGNSASYVVPANRYRVTVSAVGGAVWTIYRMGPHRTLEFQGKVAQGQKYSLVVVGTSVITLGSPGNATVTVNSSVVHFPSPLRAPLVLTFRPAPTPG